MRELLNLKVGDWELVGTYHPPQRISEHRVGCLFVNPGHVPRDGHGGLAAKACDRMAARGLHCFRFDMPGLGDTKGMVPQAAETLYDFVASGGYAGVTTELAVQTQDRYNLQGIIMGGLCGAAVNGIYSADSLPKTIRALMLLEPEMFKTVPQGETAEERNAPVENAGVIERVASQVFSYWGWMTLLTAENRYAKYVPMPRKAILNLLNKRKELPSVANLRLVEAWQRVRARRTPTLVITAQGKIREVFFDRINTACLQRVGTEGMEHIRVEGTNHLFTTGGAMDRVVGVMENWSEKTSSRVR
ncbi:MAG: hypothetical protein MUF54_03360 [Polyangiaceae bacterium]|jgi:hypothetical protein|nr:hypothetical protein [Polyangiaceae bacterium]